MAETPEPILQFFRWKHLKPEFQAVSKPFGVLAAHVVRTIPRNAERTACLRKLREAKDCAVTACLPVETTEPEDLIDPPSLDLVAVETPDGPKLISRDALAAAVKV